MYYILYTYILNGKRAFVTDERTKVHTTGRIEPFGATRNGSDPITTRSNIQVQSYYTYRIEPLDLYYRGETLGNFLGMKR